MPQKFSFDVSFDHLGTPTTRSLQERRFTRSELDATRVQGRTTPVRIFEPVTFAAPLVLYV